MAFHLGTKTPGSSLPRVSRENSAGGERHESSESGVCVCVFACVFVCVVSKNTPDARPQHRPVLCCVTLLGPDKSEPTELQLCEQIQELSLACGLHSGGCKQRRLATASSPLLTQRGVRHHRGCHHKAQPAHDCRHPRETGGLDERSATKELHVGGVDRVEAHLFCCGLDDPMQLYSCTAVLLYSCTAVQGPAMDDDLGGGLASDDY